MLCAGIIGGGYVGLVSAAGLAKNKDTHIFVCESDKDRLHKLQYGQCPIVEPGLSEALFTNPVSSISFWEPDLFRGLVLDVIFICVGTPSHADESVDTSQIESALELIRSFYHRVGLIVIRSTVPPGTTRKVRAEFELSGAVDLPVVCHHPEFLQQGSALADFQNSTRNVFGIVDKIDRAVVDKLSTVLYGRFSRVVSAETSELSKYMNNAFLATKISFANEANRIAADVGANYRDVADIIGEDPRIGRSFLAPGMGAGGSCISKDIKGILSVCQSRQIDTPVIRGALQTNRDVAENLCDIIVHLFGTPNTITRQALIIDGMAFKSGTDDTRNSIIVSVLTKASLALPATDICFVDATAAKSTACWGGLTRIKHDLLLTQSYAEAAAWLKYKQLGGVILSQERAQNDIMDFLFCHRRCTVLDCRPTPEKEHVAGLCGAKYIPFVG